MSNIKNFKYSWIWNKIIQGNPLIAKYQPLKIHEDVLVFSFGKGNYKPQMTKGKKRIKGGGRSKLWNVPNPYYESDEYYPKTIIEFSNANRKDIKHPTEKPVALFEYLIKTYTNEGDLVLDNCAGSGTAGVACKNTNRNYILIEKEPEYIEVINKRLQDLDYKTGENSIPKM